MNKSGFLILSLTIYAAIVTLIVATMARLALLFIPTMHLLINWSYYTSFYTAQSFVQQQLALAPRDQSLFIQCEPHRVTWKAGNRIKSIAAKNGNLIYTEGDYNEGAHRDIKTTLLVRDCTFTIARGTDNSLTCEAQLKKDPHYQWQCRQASYV